MLNRSLCSLTARLSLTSTRRQIALNYTPFIWSNGAWTLGKEKTAITIDDVVVAPHAAVQFSVPVKAERTTEKGIYSAIPLLISVDNWNQLVPVYKSVIVVNSEKIWDKDSDAPGGCGDRRDNDGDGWVAWKRTSMRVYFPE